MIVSMMQEKEPPITIERDVTSMVYPFGWIVRDGYKIDWCYTRWGARRIARRMLKARIHPQREVIE